MSSMTNTDLLNTFKASIAEADTDALVELARENDGRTLNATQRQMGALVADEIIRRHPEVVAALDTWEADLDTEATFTEVLVGAVADLAAEQVHIEARIEVTR